MNSQSFFNQQARERINQAVTEAEQNTAGEIVPVLATASGEYARAQFLTGACAAILATLAIIAVNCLLAFTGAHSQPESFDGAVDWFAVAGETLKTPLYFVFPLQIAAGLCGYYLARRIPALKRTFVSRAELEGEVERAAHEQFYRQRLSATRDSTGIMIYVTLFERMVVILADKGIDAKHSRETWDKVRDRVLNGFKQGKPDEGLVDAIAECGRILTQDFPRKADDTNELANQLRTV